MKAHTLVASALVIGLSLPAMAQQSPHRYVAFFNYSEAAVKAMTETPARSRGASSRAGRELRRQDGSCLLVPGW
jgi:hypothetical protein